MNIIRTSNICRLEISFLSNIFHVFQVLRKISEEAVL